MESIACNKMFGGEQRRYKHKSETLSCDMHFSIYLPPQVSEGRVPVLYWLSGLTGTDENFVIKAGAQRVAFGAWARYRYGGHQSKRRRCARRPRAGV